MRLIITTAFLLFTAFNAFSDNPPETIYDEGVRQGVAYRLNCVGDGITCTQSGVTGTITVNGGGSQTPWTSDIDAVGFRLTNTGNIGVGSTAPGQSVDTQGQVRAIDGGLASPAFQVGNNGISSPLAGQLNIISSGVERMRVTGAGNIGIGTTAPSGILVIGTNDFRIATDGTINRVGDQACNLSGTALTCAISGGSHTLGNTGTASGSLTLVQGGAHAGSSLTLKSTTANGTSDSIRFQTGNEVERARFDTNGNLGIGTTVMASGKLQLPANGSATGQAVCFGTNNCIGYCTAGTYPACSSCTCM